jgi:hypothetical protein
MNAIFTILLAYGLLTLLYRLGVRPLLKSAVIERIEQREAELEALLEAGAVKPEDFCHQFLVRHCSIKDRLESCSISDLVHFMFSKRVPKTLFEDLKRFQNEATPEMKSLHDGLCKDLGLWLAINSPFYCIIVTAAVLMTILLRYMDESMVKRRAQVFVNAEACGCPA